MNCSRLVRGLFLFLLVICAIPGVTAPIALIAGALLALTLGNPWPQQTALRSKQLLQVSVILLGFGMDLFEVLKTGRDAFVYTLVGITVTVVVGSLIGTFLATPKRISLLVTFGTAICGGSAIAAIAPAIQAEPEEVAVALGAVFVLNSVALLVFPPIGHLLGMGQRPFGLWAALAIHDTSSVVGAAAAYGATALSVGTTVKLARALWIVPVSLVTSWVHGSKGKSVFPGFIVGFFVAALLRTLLPQFRPLWGIAAQVAHQSLVVTLFLIGAGLSRAAFAKSGARPLVQGVLLWVFASVTSAYAILAGVIR